MARRAAAMLKLKDEGASLVITVDCGAAAIAALTAARDAGLDVVVLDHHAVETLPPAFAHVNPNQPGDTSGLGLSLRRRRDVPVPGRAQPRSARERLVRANETSPSPICARFSIWSGWRRSAMSCR